MKKQPSPDSNLRPEETRPAARRRPEAALPCITVSSGSLRLDIALGGGIPTGQVVELSGPEASGKTTLCLHMTAAAQKLGAPCAWIDADCGLDLRYAAACGVDPDRLFVCSPKSGEQALDMAQTLVGSGALGVIVVDSLPALVPQAELDLPLGVWDSRRDGDPKRRPPSPTRPAPAAERALSNALLRMRRLVQDHRIILVFTSLPQARMSAAYHGLEENLPRLALKLHAGLRLQLKPLERLRKGDQQAGQRVQARVVKHRAAPAATRFSPVDLDIMYNEGITRSGEIFDFGTDLLVITREGHGYFYQGYRLGDDRDQAVDWICRHPEIQDELEAIIRRRLLPPVQRAAEL